MLCVLRLLCLDVEKRRNPVCGFVTPLEGSEADSHGKPEVSCYSQRISRGYDSWLLKEKEKEKKDSPHSLLPRLKNHNYNRKISGSCWRAKQPWYRLSCDCCVPLEGVCILCKCVFPSHIIRRSCWRAATGSEGLRWWSRSITSGGSTTRRGWALYFWRRLSNPENGSKHCSDTTSWEWVESEAEMIIHLFDQSDVLYTVSLVVCSFRGRRMISSPSCTRYGKWSRSIFWPLKRSFDQLTQIPLWVFALFLCRSSGKSTQLLFLAYWFSLSQPTGGIK